MQSDKVSIPNVFNVIVVVVAAVVVVVVVAAVVVAAVAVAVAVLVVLAVTVVIVVIVLFCDLFPFFSVLLLSLLFYDMLLLLLVVVFSSEPMDNENSTKSNIYCQYSSQNDCLAKWTLRRPSKPKYYKIIMNRFHPCSQSIRFHQPRRLQIKTVIFWESCPSSSTGFNEVFVFSAYTGHFLAILRMASRL